MLLEAASIEGAQVWAERFRQDTAATAVVCGEVSISYSASMGGALLDPRLHSVEQVMLQADSALYQAKKTRVQPSCGRTSISELRGDSIRDRSGDEGKASRPDQNISRPMGSDDVLRAL
ncbi:diguanylate cyclase [Klebsiella pneumoniae]